MIRASTLLLLASVVFSATFAIVAVRRDDRSGIYLFKPLTTFIILIGAAWLVRPAVPLYRDIVVLGLALSLAGDVLLMLPGNRFVAGLGAFLLAHLAYLAAFSVGSPPAAAQAAWLIPFVALTGAVVTYCWTSLGARKGPVVFYAAVISVMAWRAAMRGQAPVPRSSFVLALIGACLFIASDAIVLVRRFRHPFPAAHTLELASYWAAQVLIALSIRA